jgi:hypothetical protein
VFKDSQYAAECRRDQLLGVLPEVPPCLIELCAARQTRILVGAVGILGFLALMYNAIAIQNHSGLVVFATWLLMAISFPVFYAIARRRMNQLVRRQFAQTGDVFADVARFERSEPLQMVIQRAQRLERFSLIMPMVAASLLTPLSLHLLVGTTLFSSAEFFNSWVLVSLILVGHAHLTLIIFSIIHVVRLQRDLDHDTLITGASSGLRALLWTVAASTIPGAALICVPPILVGFTGILFVPWMFQWAAYRAQWERNIIDSLRPLSEN